MTSKKCDDVNSRLHSRARFVELQGTVWCNLLSGLARDVAPEIAPLLYSLGWSELEGPLT
jgi:hypothetical protein